MFEHRDSAVCRRSHLHRAQFQKLFHRRIGIVLPMQSVLTVTLMVSNIQRLNVFWEALYCANFRSMRCGISKDDFS
jgi:hypothetical protein